MGERSERSTLVPAVLGGGVGFVLGLLAGVGFGGPGAGGGKPGAVDLDAGDRSMYLGTDAPEMRWRVEAVGNSYVNVDQRPGYRYSYETYPWDVLRPGQAADLYAAAGSHGSVEQWRQRGEQIMGSGRVDVIDDVAVGAAAGPRLRAVFAREHEALVRRHAKRLMPGGLVRTVGRFVSVEGPELDALGEVEALRMVAEQGLPLVQLVRVR